MMPVRRAGRPLTTCPHNPGVRCDCRPGAIAAAANTTPLITARSRGSGRAQEPATPIADGISTVPDIAPERAPDWTTPTVSSQPLFSSAVATPTPYFRIDDPILPSMDVHRHAFDSVPFAEPSLMTTTDSFDWAAVDASPIPTSSFDNIGGTPTATAQSPNYFFGASETFAGMSMDENRGRWSPSSSLAAGDQYLSFTDLLATTESTSYSHTYGDGGGEEGNRSYY